MLHEGVSPVLVGRQDELSRLEDALLSVNRGDGRFAVLVGEAGIGKSRLAAELTERARKLGFEVLRGSCAEAELALPYLPFVEALGNRLDDEDRVALLATLGPAAAELAQLFPQLASGPGSAPAGDPGHAKLRLFESVVQLLTTWARARGVVLVLEDIHWADSSTRELLDYLARRLVRSRVLLVATMRSDELDRGQPLAGLLRAWTHGGLAQTVELSPIAPPQVAELIAAILDAEQVSPELVAFVGERAEGNPFVLEEMLREAVDRGEIVHAPDGWRRSSLDALPMPATVREAVILRLARLDAEQVEVLRTAAVLGRWFDRELLMRVAESDAAAVSAALESAAVQHLVEPVAGSRGRYGWRHALTQEAVASDTPETTRRSVHSHAADALAETGGSAIDVAWHLLGAGRDEEAVGACLRAADEAERSLAYREAVDLLARVLPRVADPRERALLLARIGQLRWLNGEPAAAEGPLAEGVDALEAIGLAPKAARARLFLGRCRWELDRPDDALRDYEQARDVLEATGPLRDLAFAYVRIAGIHAFQLDYGRCRESAERAVAIAEQADADYERVWALAHVALGYFGSRREFELFDECFSQAIGKGYSIIAGNLLYNETWDRVHTLTGGLERLDEKVARLPVEPWLSSGGSIAESIASLAGGRPRESLEHARAAVARHTSLGASKFAWRSQLAVSEALLELGRVREAADELPPPSPAHEIQDIVYDTPALMGVAIERGRLDEGVSLAQRVAAGDEAVLIFGETVAIAIDALVLADRLAEAEALLARAKAAPGELGDAGFALAEGRILLARGEPSEALARLERAIAGFDGAGLQLWSWRATVLAADAAARAGDRASSTARLNACVRECQRAGCVRLRDHARATAGRLGIELEPLEDGPVDDVSEPELVRAGERFVTSLFADVRDYTGFVTANAPEEVADRISTLHRWAASDVARRHGIVDKLAGDAAMATFNAVGARVDHATLALEAALAIRDKGILIDLPVGIGIAVGPAVVTRSVAGGNVSVLGESTNLAARLQTAASAGEILLSEEAFRRVATWLDERGMAVEQERLELKGFAGAQAVYRLVAPASPGRG